MTKPVSRPAKRPRRPGTPAAAPAQRQSGKAAKTDKTPRHFAIIGAGMAGVVCARTLVQAGHQVTVFEKSSKAGGRTTTIDSPFGSFDAGAQYFTVRDPRFAQAIDTVPGVCRPWSANAVRVLDAEKGKNIWLQIHRENYAKLMLPHVREARALQMELLVETIYEINKPQTRKVVLRPN